MNLVVDASIAIKWFLPESFSDQAGTLLTGGDVLFAPAFLLVECGNILWKKVRLGQMSRGDSHAALETLASGPLDYLPTTPLIEQAVDLTHAIDHPLYDCLYLAAAEAIDATLVTADRQLFERATRSSLERQVAWIADWARGRPEAPTD